MTRKIILFTLLASFLAQISFVHDACGQSAKGLRTVVIDPGHGGKDPGALGMYNAKSAYHEKDIVLAVSLLLGKKIEKAFPDVKVIYTRTTDVFITRSDRAKLANKHADLFISIHCNGSKNLNASGSSVHILGPKSKHKDNPTDYFAKNQNVAKSKNNLIVVDGDDVTVTSIDASQTSDHISSSLQWKAIYESSLLFATEVIDKLIKAPLHPRDVVLDQEVVDVLAYTSRPAVLLELAFVTNTKEYNYLKTAAAQEEIAERIFQAFAAYKPVYDSCFDIDFSSVSAPEIVEDDAECVNEGNVSAEKPVDKSGSNKTSVQGEYYGVQFMAGSRVLKANDPAFKGFPAHSVKAGNIYKYIIGKYSSKAEAQAELSKVRKSFPDAFVVKVTGNVVTRP